MTDEMSSKMKVMERILQITEKQIGRMSGLCRNRDHERYLRKDCVEGGCPDEIIVGDIIEE